MPKLLSYPQAIVFILDFLARFRQVQNQLEVLANFIATLRQYANNEAFVNDLFRQPEFDAIEFKQTCLIAECLLEKAMAKSVINGDTQALDQRMEKAWPSHAIEAAILKECSNKVFILGSGAIPLSAMIYYESHQLQVTCIDYDGDAITLSQSVVKKRYGSETAKQHFHFVQQNAMDLTIEEKDPLGLTLASHCENKVSLLNHCKHQIAQYSRIICRSPKLLYQFIYGPLDWNTVNGYRQISNPNWGLTESPVLLPSTVLERY